MDGSFGRLECLTFSLSTCHADPTLTVENVIDVMEKVTEDRRRQVWETVLKIMYYGYEQTTRVYAYFDEIYRSHSSEREKTHACSDMYVNCHPESSWEHLTSHLYKEDEMTAVEQARTFLPPRGKSIIVYCNTKIFFMYIHCALFL